MKFAFIQEQGQEWPVGSLCRILSVSRSGYVVWCRRRHQAPSPRQQEKRQEEARLRLQIRAAHRKGRHYYGSPRVYDELREQGVCVSRKRVARVMREEGLVGRSRARRRVQTTDSRYEYLVANNLLERRFAPQQVQRPNRFWCGDITYLPTAEGWLYLATVKDLFSRRILGWALQDTLEATLVTTAWQQALETRGYGPQTLVTTAWQQALETRGYGPQQNELAQGPELYHSDRGSQYAGKLFQELLRRSGTQASMSRSGECLDNAVAESFFGTLKAELLADQPGGRFVSKAQAVALVNDYIGNFYNPVRRHSALGHKSPIAFELAHQVRVT